MANKEIDVVIRIDEEYYNDLKSLPLLPFSTYPEEIIYKGVPLPKGHGRLKDIDKIISDGISKGFCDWYDEMKYADTIIEADKESEDEE